MTVAVPHTDHQRTEAAVHTRRRQWLLLLFLAVALAAGGLVYGYVRLTYFRTVGNGPAGPPWTDTHLFEGPWSLRPALVVGMGDSVTAGFGARKGYGYFERLVRPPADDFEEFKKSCLSAALPNLRVTNLAVSGSTSFECLRLQLPRLIQQDTGTVGIVVITTGGNDLLHNYGRTPPRQQAMYGASWEQAQPWIQGFQRRLDALLTGVFSRFPGGCHVFIGNIYDPTDDVGDIQKAGLPAWHDGQKILEAYNNVIESCAGRYTNVHLVDLHDLFLGHGIHCRQFWSPHYDSHDPHYWYHTNVEDPNERGYDAIRRAFLREISRTSESLR